MPETQQLFNFRNVIIEVLGTMFLVFYGGMAVNIASYKWEDPVNHVEMGFYANNPVNKKEAMFGVALCHGLILGIYIYAGASSGGDCHFNPAVTLGMILLRKCRFVAGLIYMVAQAAGSFLGALLCMLQSYGHSSVPLSFATNATVNATADTNIEVTWKQAGLMEFLNTFFLMTIILAFTSKKEIPKQAFGGAIGLMLCILICGTGKLTGCAANPFRALGPNILGGVWFPLVIYCTFPFLGSLFACFIFKVFIEDNLDEAEDMDKSNTIDDVENELK